MRNYFKKLLDYIIYACILLLCNNLISANPENPQSTIMWMNQPAKTWYEATPIGNGRLGGMIFGGITHERIQTNDDTFWSGVPKDVQNTLAAQYLPCLLYTSPSPRDRQKSRMP